MIKTMFKMILMIASISLNSLASSDQFINETSNWTFRGEVISAFPDAIKKIQLRENYLVYKIYEGQDAFGKDLRVELFYTGDDAEFYPQFYILTNASESSDWPSSSMGKAYYIKEFSSPDLELGEIAPQLDPFEMSDEEIKSFILKSFLKPDLTINR